MANDHADFPDLIAELQSLDPGQPVGTVWPLHDDHAVIDGDGVIAASVDKDRGVLAVQADERVVANATDQRIFGL